MRDALGESVKNKKIERALNALEGIFEVKKGIGKAVKDAKDQVSSYSLQGLFLVKEFSDSVEEIFKNEPPTEPTDKT